MNLIKGIRQAQELKKIQTLTSLKQISQGKKSGEFNINLDPVHLDKSQSQPIKSRMPSFFSVSKTQQNVSREGRKSFLINRTAPNAKGLENLQSPRVSDFSKQSPLVSPATSASASMP